MRDFWWDYIQNKKIVGIDLDGVLVDYPKCWVDFINQNYEPVVKGEIPPFQNLYEAKAQIPYDIYRTLKHLYRSSGYKVNLPPKPDVDKFSKTLKRAGYKIFILTSRPLEKYENLFKITLEWLRRNKVLFDGLVFGKDKHIKIIYTFPTLNFMVEDHRGIANLVARWGYDVYLIDNEYNQGDLEEKVYRVKGLLDIVNMVPDLKEAYEGLKKINFDWEPEEDYSVSQDIFIDKFFLKNGGRK